MYFISVLASNHAPVAQEFLKRGCPRSLRGRIWAQVMGSHLCPEHTEYFKELKHQVLQYDLMVDKLIIKVKETFFFSMCAGELTLQLKLPP